MMLIIPIILLFAYFFGATIFFIEALATEDANHQILYIIISSLFSTCIILDIVRIIILLSEQGVL